MRATPYSSMKRDRQQSHQISLDPCSVRISNWTAWFRRLTCKLGATRTQDTHSSVRKQRRFGAIQVLATVMMMSCVVPGGEDRSAVKVVLDGSAEQSAHFSVKSEGNYRLVLSFRYPPVDAGVATTLDRLSRGGSPQTARDLLRLQWVLQRGAASVQHGSSETSILGIVDRGGRGLGGDRISERGVVLSRMHLDPGDDYLLRFTLGEDDPSRFSGSVIRLERDYAAIPAGDQD
jgi:hypothetical protein